MTKEKYFQAMHLLNRIEHLQFRVMIDPFETMVEDGLVSKEAAMRWKNELYAERWKEIGRLKLEFEAL